MKAFKIIIAIVIGLPILFVAIGMALPKESTVKRSIDIKASAGEVFALVGDLRDFGRWDPWSEKDPEMEIGYSGPSLGVGSVRTWSGNDQVGQGSMTIVEFSPNSRVEMLLDFGQMGGGSASYDLVENADSTTITWSFRTVHNNIFERYFGLILDGVLGKEYEKGLASLKEVAENSPSIKTEEVTYRVGDTQLSGFIAYPIGLLDPVPGVLVVHEWWGHNDYARDRAKQLAELGYVAMAIDMYGDGKLASHPEDAMSFMTEVTENKEVAVARFDAATEILQNHYYSDGERIAAIGYCFGGTLAMNMAIAGKPLKGVASFHGGLGNLSPVDGYITTPLLVLNGADDPIVTAEQKEKFKQDMDAANIVYEFIDYPGVKHSFTNPGADAFGEKFKLPLKYDAEADQDSWQRLDEFLRKVLF